MDKHYVVGVDPASGKEKGNESVAIVLCVETGEQAAIIAGQIHPEVMADEVERGGHFYNEAELAIERELHGATIISKLKDKYPNIYYHYESLVGMSDSVSKEYGWDPRRYRQTAIDWLQQDIGYATSEKPADRKLAVWVFDIETTNQLGYFIKNEKSGKWEATPGKKDDRVSAMYIANFVRRQRFERFINTIVEVKKEKTFMDELSASSVEDKEERSMDWEF